MVKGKRRQSAKRGGEAFEKPGSRGRDDDRWGEGDPEDDPLRDLRPYEDDMRNQANDEYVWPDVNDEYDEDD
jgi:hypothetical protein